MRIALVSYEYPPQNGLGGVGSYTFRLAGALGRCGHDVIVLAGPNDEDDLVQPNVTVHRIPARYDPPLGLKSLRWLYWRVFARAMNWANPMVWHWLRWDLATGEALRQIHERTPIDVVEAPEHAANGLVVGRARRWPMVVRVHGPWDLFFGLNRTGGTPLNRLLAYLERESTRYAHTLTTPSRTMARFIQDRWNLPHAPKVLPNFMDVPIERYPLAPAGGAQKIVCAGRIERFKGQDVLVRAFAAVAEAHPRARLVLIGPDQWSDHEPFARYVDSVAPDPGVRARIVLTGPVPLQRVQHELRTASIAAVCSTGFESFSFSTLEAMSAARPIIACQSGAIPELLADGDCGLLVPRADDLQLADGLDRLLCDRDLCAHLGTSAHRRARAHYDTAAVIPRYVEAYGRTQEAVQGWTEFPKIEELMAMSA